jgi:hypothetical protein
VSDLDEALGEAISQLVEGGMVQGSQQNPLLSIFAEALRGKIDAPPIVEASIRTDDGKFKKLEEWLLVVKVPMFNMARRKAAPRRRGPRMTSILGLAEGYVQANIVTEQLMKVNPLEFVVGDVVPGVASGGGISLIEIMRRPELLGTIGMNASNPAKLANIAVQSLVARAAFRFGKRILRPNINLLNRLVFRPANIGVKLWPRSQ